MARINYKSLLEAYRALPVPTANEHLRTAIKDGYVNTGHLDLGAMFIEAYGFHAFNDCRTNQELANRYMEADAVTTAAFSNITGQIVYSRVMDAFAAETQIASGLVETISTRFQGEKIPGVSEIGDQASIVNETENYPFAGVSEDYIETPDTVKRGLIVPVSREAIFFDRTNLVLRRCQDVGRWLGQNKEKRIWDCIIDENVTKHRYKWRGTTYATYQASTPWINLNATNGLSDYTNIDDSRIMFSQMTDPNTGEPITIVPNTVLVTPSKLAAARRIVNATQVQHGTGAAKCSMALVRRTSRTRTIRLRFSLRSAIRSGSSAWCRVSFWRLGLRRTRAGSWATSNVLSPTWKIGLSP